MRTSLLVLLVAIVGCANSEYRFERIDGDQITALPLKFEGIVGVRDAASVVAEARFSDGGDFVTMKINVHLGPPAVFSSGTYQATIGGMATTGIVECPSLDYLGGQNSQPSIGGLFRLKDEQNQPAYQIRIPVTVMKRQSNAF